VEPCAAKFDEFHLSYTFHIFFFQFDAFSGFSDTVQNVAALIPILTTVKGFLLQASRVTPKSLIIHINEKLVWCYFAIPSIKLAALKKGILPSEITVSV
jgi:hypothetical protein